MKDKTERLVDDLKFTLRQMREISQEWKYEDKTLRAYGLDVAIILLKATLEVYEGNE